MQIEIHLKGLLEKHGKDQWGIIKKMADDLKVHRHTINKLYHNQFKNPPLKLLGDVCRWLEHNGVREDFPAALFGTRPDGLWRALVQCGAVTFYLGEYRQLEHTPYPLLWIARRDATVHAQFVNELSVTRKAGATPLEVGTKYVPFHLIGRSVNPRQFEDDVAGAEKAFQSLRSGRAQASILIGSQRVNYLVEHLVADLFGCTAFTPSKGKPKVPFYIAYHGRERLVSSCFGGSTNPPKCRTSFAPGVMYLTAKGEWVLCPWELRKQDAGVVLVAYDEGNQRMELAVIGYSGRATEIIGEHLLGNLEKFWPPEAASRGRAIGVFICRFTMTSELTGDASQVHSIEVIPLDSKMVAGYLA